MPRDLLRVTHAVEAEHLYISAQTIALSGVATGKWINPKKCPQP